MTLADLLKLHDHSHALRRLVDITTGTEMRAGGAFRMECLAAFFDDPDVAEGIKHNLATSIVTAVQAAVDREIGNIERVIESIVTPGLPADDKPV